MMIPFPVLMIPLYAVSRELGWIGTLSPLWVPAVFGSAFNIFLLRQFFLTVPSELSDAARIDGCSELGIFEEGLRRLTAIPDIQTAHFGRPAATPPRPVIDDSYAWALIETFHDLAAHDRYQAHEIPRQFLQEFSSSWQKVQVYDVRV
jgi:hypothetical protein